MRLRILVTLALVVTLLAAAGCTRIYSVEANKPVESYNYLDPEVGETTQKDVGENLLTTGKTTVYKGITLTKEFSSLATVVPPKLIFHKGTNLKQIATRGDLRVFVGTPSTSPYEKDAEVGFALDSQDQLKMMYYNGQLTNPVTMTKQLVEYTPATIKEIDYGRLRKEFIYKGRSGDDVFFTYRERNTYAKKVWDTQEVRYNIKEDRVIGFKGVRLEVLSADNRGISYRIISAYNSMQ